jgi:hypothetical protein
MPRLRRREKPVEPMLPTEAICVEAFRPWPISAYIERGTRMELTHPAVKAHPEYFMGLVALPRPDDGKR